MGYENDASQAIQALADVATDEDTLFHDGFVKGVSEFIKECPTPMTIAIQGDWGAGKTSLINLIDTGLQAKAQSEDGDNPDAKKYCEDIIGVVTVDAWKQSIVNPRIGLPEILLGEMAWTLAGSNLSEAKNISSFATAATHILNAISGKGSESEDDFSFESIIDWLFDLEDDSKSQSEEKFVSNADIAAFRTSCIEALEQSAQKNGKTKDSRFVIFVDGLDYINPETAIDLMEQVKTYIECPRCVFVLAIDERTVFDGAKKKLGDKADESQKKMLFDKYVQVPLRIPAGAYNLDKYIAGLLKDGKELSGELVEVADILLSKPTPRRIKRCINTMYLYRSVSGGQESTEDGSLAMLFAAAILKTESAQGFDAVAGCTEGDKAHFAESLEAALEPLGQSDGINWAMLPTLWSGKEGADVDAAKRDAFISWVQKLQ